MTRSLFTLAWMAALGEVFASETFHTTSPSPHHRCHNPTRYEGSMFSGSGYHSGMMPGNMSSMSRPGSTLQRGQVHLHLNLQKNIISRSGSIYSFPIKLSLSHIWYFTFTSHLNSEFRLQCFPHLISTWNFRLFFCAIVSYTQKNIITFTFF